MENNVEKLVELFGGAKAELARICGVNPAMIWRWGKPNTWQSGRARGRDGHLPTQYNRAVMAAARERVANMSGKDAFDFVSAVSACLDPAVCPTCGQSIDDGRVL